MRNHRTRMGIKPLTLALVVKFRLMYLLFADYDTVPISL